jgi:hypothetical protein
MTPCAQSDDMESSDNITARSERRMGETPIFTRWNTAFEAVEEPSICAVAFRLKRGTPTDIIKTLQHSAWIVTQGILFCFPVKTKKAFEYLEGLRTSPWTNSLSATRVESTGLL